MRASPRKREPKERARGTTALSRQAACPFSAALGARLDVRGLPSPVDGIAPARRGELAHAALQALWLELGDSAALARLDEAGRQRAIGRALEHAFQAAERHLPPGRIRRLERDWLGAALARLLAADAERVPFSVAAREEPLTATLAGHPVSGRLDRLDRLTDGGGTVLIDYKTGRASPRGWSDERLVELQLPLYATTLDPPPDAVVVARLAPGVRVYAGVARAAGLLPGVLPPAGDAPAYAALVGDWRLRLEGLAREFAAGEGDVAPSGNACLYCSHLLVCRLPTDPADRSEREGAVTGADGEGEGEGEDDGGLDD